MNFWHHHKSDFVNNNKNYGVLYFNMSMDNDETLKEILSNDRFFGSSCEERQMAGLILKYRGHSIDELRSMYNS